MNLRQLIVTCVLLHVSHAVVALNVKAPVTNVGMVTFQYTAETSAPARKQGIVSAGGLNWSCTGNRCTISGPWPTPGESSCKALAGVVGVISTYGHSGGAKLNPKQLAQCNAGLSASTANVADSKTQSSLSSVVPAPKGGLAGTATINSTTTRQLANINPALSRQLAVRSSLYANIEQARQQAEAQARERAEEMRERSRNRGFLTVLDCDDSRRDVSPNAPEVCDGRDNNCDGVVDEGQTLPRYLDADGDGHGNSASRINVCPRDIAASAERAEAGTAPWLVEIGNDCDDNNADRWHNCE